MIAQNQTVVSRFAGAWLLVAACAYGLISALGCEDAPRPADSAQAEAALQQFADFFKTAPAYQVRSRMEMVVTDTDGRRHDELALPAEERTIAVQRPSQFVFTSSNGVNIMADGTSLAAWSTAHRKYWRGAAAFSLADPLDGRVRAFFQTPLNGRLLQWASRDPAAALMLDLGSPAYIGREVLHDRPAHHLRAPAPWNQETTLMSRPTLDVWIAAEGEPVPLQIIVTQPPREIALAAGATMSATAAMTETFQDWSFEAVAPEKFEFQRPAGARRVSEIDEVLADDDPLVGHPAPELNLPLLGGGMLRLADHIGKDVVILDFWATWCQPCLMELPVIASVAQDFQDRSVVLYAVNQGQSRADVAQFMASAKHPLTVALDSAQTAMRVYRSESIPRLVLIGKDGRVQVVHAGFNPTLEERVRQELDALVTGVDLASDGLPDTPSE